MAVIDNSLVPSYAIPGIEHRTVAGPKDKLRSMENQVHQIINTGSEPMHLVAALGMVPVIVETAHGERVALPWDQPA